MKNEIDDAVLPTLTAKDPKDLGVDIVGHQKLLDAFALIRGDAESKRRAGYWQVAHRPGPDGAPK